MISSQLCGLAIETISRLRKDQETRRMVGKQNASGDNARNGEHSVDDDSLPSTVSTSSNCSYSDDSRSTIFTEFDKFEESDEPSITDKIYRWWHMDIVDVTGHPKAPRSFSIGSDTTTVDNLENQLFPRHYCIETSANIDITVHFDGIIINNSYESTESEASQSQSEENNNNNNNNNNKGIIPKSPPKGSNWPIAMISQHKNLPTCGLEAMQFDGNNVSIINNEWQFCTDINNSNQNYIEKFHAFRAELINKLWAMELWKEQPLSDGQITKSEFTEGLAYLKTLSLSTITEQIDEQESSSSDSSKTPTSQLLQQTENNATVAAELEDVVENIQQQLSMEQQPETEKKVDQKPNVRFRINEFQNRIAKASTFSSGGTGSQPRFQQKNTKWSGGGSFTVKSNSKAPSGDGGGRSFQTAKSRETDGQKLKNASNTMKCDAVNIPTTKSKSTTAPQAARKPVNNSNNIYKQQQLRPNLGINRPPSITNTFSLEKQRKNTPSNPQAKGYGMTNYRSEIQRESYQCVVVDFQTKSERAVKAEIVEQKECQVVEMEEKNGRAAKIEMIDVMLEGLGVIIDNEYLKAEKQAQRQAAKNDAQN